MYVDKIIETPQGKTHVQCEFTQEESEMIFTVGLTRLLEVGALPFSLIAQEEAANFAPGGNG